MQDQNDSAAQAADQSSQAKPYHFDKEAIYDAEIAPVIERLRELCKEHRLPMVAIVQYSSGDNSHGCAHGQVLFRDVDASQAVIAASMMLKASGMASAGSTLAEAMLNSNPLWCAAIRAGEQFRAEQDAATKH